MPGKSPTVVVFFELFILLKNSPFNFPKEVLKGIENFYFDAYSFFNLFFASGVGFPLYLEIFYFIHNDPAAHQDHCGRCRI